MRKADVDKDELSVTAPSDSNDGERGHSRRHRGDEFVILLAEVSQASDAVMVAEKVIAALGAPSRAGQHVFRLTSSIGISVYPDDGDDAETLIDRADAAMYIAKKHGLGSFAFHGQEAVRGADPHLPKAL
jgi:diguanylate cyclase (GGDEF)-like protein